MNNPIFSFGNSLDVVFVSKTTGKMSLSELEFPKLISTLLYVSTGSVICYNKGDGKDSLFAQTLYRNLGGWETVSHCLGT